MHLMGHDGEDPAAPHHRYVVDAKGIRSDSEEEDDREAAGRRRPSRSSSPERNSRDDNNDSRSQSRSAPAIFYDPIGKTHPDTSAAVNDSANRLRLGGTSDGEPSPPP